MTDYARLYALRSCPTHLQACQRWEELDRLLTDPLFLEAKVQAGMTFQLVADFTAASATPTERPQRRIVALLGEALGRDAHFIAQRVQDSPQVLFQCLWNSCWWYDNPDVPKHYVPSETGHASGTPPSVPTSLGLHELLERWRDATNARFREFPWIRFLRPPVAGPSSRLVAQLTGHMGAVNAVAFTANGQRALSSAADGTVRTWDRRSTTELRCVYGHAGAVIAAAFSPDGRLIASGSSDGTVRLCAVENAEQRVCLHGHSNTVKALAFSSDGQHILSGSADRTVRRWNLAERKQTDCFFWHASDVSCVAVSLDNQRIASGAQDGQLVLWDGKSLRHLRGHTSGVACVAFSPDGRRVASGSWDGTIRLWDCESGAEMKCLRGHGHWVSGVCFSTCGNRLASCAHDTTVRVWDAHTGAELNCFRGHSGAVNAIAFLPDEGRLVSGSTEGKVCLWTLEGPSAGVPPPTHSSLVTRIAFSPDGRWIVSGSVDGDLSLWDATTGAKLRELVGHNRAVSVLAFSPDSARVISVAGDLTLRTWNVADGTQLTCLSDRYINTQRVMFSRDGRRIIREDKYGWVEIWDVEKNMRLFSGRRAVFAPDGEHIIGGDITGTMELRDARTGRKIADLFEHASLVGFVALPSERARFVGVSRSGYLIRLWDIATGKVMRTFSLDRHHKSASGHEWISLEDVRMSDDSRWMLATAEIHSYDCERERWLSSTKIIVWDAQTGEEAATIPDAATLVRFTNDGERITCIDDKGYHLWSIANGDWLVKVEGQVNVASLRHEAEISQIVVWQGEYGAVVNTQIGAVAAWIPHRLDPVALHPRGNGWAGAIGNDIEIATLEKG